jgi:cyclophilin family peptidyl-prolyl cis-trans isomerase
MLSWFARSPRKDKGRSRRFVPRLEGLEDRLVPAVPIVDPIAHVTPNVPSGKTLFIPVTGSDAAGNPLNYSVTSSNGAILTAAVRNSGNVYVTVSVANFGNMTFQLFGDLTPTTVDTITGLIKSGFYDGLKIHRVAANFVIQTGDPTGTGSGGPGFTFDDEYNVNDIWAGNGQLGMANSGNDTNGSQFFVTNNNQPRNLDFTKIMFGQLVRGFDVLAAIDAVPTTPANDGMPNTPIFLNSVRVVQDTSDAVLQLTSTTLNSTGSATITVTATDSVTGEVSAAQTFTATIVNDSANNDSPFLNPVANQSTAENTPITFPVSGTDLEGDPLTFTATEVVPTGGTAHSTITVSGSNVTVTPNMGFVGPIQVRIGVTGLHSTTSTAPATHVITVGVGPRTITNLAGPAITGTANTALSNVTVATFTDSDPSAAAGDYAAQINWGDGHLNAGTVSLGANGQYTVTGSNTYVNAGKYPVNVTITQASALGGNVAFTNKPAALNATIADSTFAERGIVITPNNGLAPTQGTSLTASVATFTDAVATDKPVDFTATIAWGDGSTSAGTIVAQSGGGFSINGTHKYLIGGAMSASVTLNHIVPDVTGTSQTVTFVINVGVRTENQRFLDHLYQDVLGRAIDPSGEATGLAFLAQGGSRVAFGLAVVQSVEAATIQVQQLYQKYLGRSVSASAGDQVALQSDVNYLHHGGSLETLRADIMGSDEYFSKHGSTNDGFINGLNTDVTAGTLSSSQHTGLVNQLNDFDTDNNLMASRFLQTDISHNLIVQQYYNQLLHRAPSTAEENLILPHQQAGLREQDLMSEIIGSDEYFNFI